MPKWTVEQQNAIDQEGSNIIVSAGAGSGKTAVLSERVIRKLEQGVDIDHLLILTFTKAAAFEMMIRIRDKIKARDALKTQLDKIDSAYITTFDSFSLALVKKYHYLLNIKKDIKIMNQNIMDIERKKMLDAIFDFYYEKEDAAFFDFLSKFTLKDDQEVRNLLLGISGKLDLKYDKISYLNHYIIKNFTEENIALVVKRYEAFLRQKISFIEEDLQKLCEYVDGNYYDCLVQSLQPLLSSQSYDEIKSHCEVKLKNLPKGGAEEAKKVKEQLASDLKELKTYLIYENREAIEKFIEQTKDSIQVMIQILLELDNQVYIYKYQHDSYEFTDIAKMAIKLVKENKEIQLELKYYFNEIMVDEYQDTSDLQEEFIRAIANDNVYMVGDIKQSIYRFRNANPYIFKHKYDRYGQNDGGVKIDLMKNFRSRHEVLDNINYVFDYIMDDFFGGCHYREEHRMVFGNYMYAENQAVGQDPNFEIYNYSREDFSEYSKDEIEAFLILKDIQEKVKNHYQVIDKETSKLRDCSYQDFAILLDRATKFELYKKIFEYKNVPMTVYKDTSITKEDDIYIFSNLLKMISLAYHKQYDEEFRYAFLSVARSYLTDLEDDEIFSIIHHQLYFESDIFKKIQGILKDYPRLTGVTLLERVIDAFDFYERQVLVGKMSHLVARISYLKTVFEEMGSLGYSLDEEIDYFHTMVNDGYDIKVSMKSDAKDSVKIMTIHKSKGLEFPVLYMAGLSNKFNIRDLNEKFIYDNQFGFIIPFFQKQEILNVSKVLMRDIYLQEEIGEKIRLFYVALTRAREKMILITCNEQEEEYEVSDLVDMRVRYKYRSFLDILKSIWSLLLPYKKQIDLQNLGLTKAYNFVKSTTFENTLKKKGKIHYEELFISSSPVCNTHYSKQNIPLLTPENYAAIETGKRFHSILENIDFLHPNYMGLSTFEKEHVEFFLTSSTLSLEKSIHIYKEYEFLFQDQEEIRHGIIDLMIEYVDQIVLIDYKLKQVVDQAYVLQLKGYKSYIQTKTDKPILLYLYSILDKKFVEL